MCVAPLRPEPKWFSSSSLGSTQVISSWNGMDLHGDCIMKGLRKSLRPTPEQPGSSSIHFNSTSLHNATCTIVIHCLALWFAFLGSRYFNDRWFGKPRGPLARVLFLSGSLSLQCETLQLQPTWQSQKSSKVQSEGKHRDISPSRIRYDSYYPN